MIANMGISTEQAAAYTTAIVAAAAAVFERIKSSKVINKTQADLTVVSDAKAWQTRAEMMQKMSDDYQALLTKEYAEHQKTREYWHNQSQEFQVTLAKCNERCSELQSKTDLSKLEQILLKQGETLTKQGETLTTLTQAVTKLLNSQDDDNRPNQKHSV